MAKPSAKPGLYLDDRCQKPTELKPGDLIVYSMGSYSMRIIRGRKSLRIREGDSTENHIQLGPNGSYRPLTRMIAALAGLIPTELPLRAPPRRTIRFRLTVP